jgi:hypothetical protein
MSKTNICVVDRNIHGYYINRPFTEKDFDGGVQCHCGVRKIKTTFYCPMRWKKHTMTQSHVKWVEHMNLERRIQQLEYDLKIKCRDNIPYYEKEELWYEHVYPEKEEY